MGRGGKAELAAVGDHQKEADLPHLRRQGHQHGTRPGRQEDAFGVQCRVRARVGVIEGVCDQPGKHRKRRPGGHAAPEVVWNDKDERQADTLG